MVRTPVPKTAIHKNDQPLAAKDEVSSASKTSDRRSIDSIADTTPMQLAPNC
jgi:hypothetical protein